MLDSTYPPAGRHEGQACAETPSATASSTKQRSGFSRSMSESTVSPPER